MWGFSAHDCKTLWNKKIQPDTLSSSCTAVKILHWAKAELNLRACFFFLKMKMYCKIKGIPTEPRRSGSAKNQSRRSENSLKWEHRGECVYFHRSSSDPHYLITLICFHGWLHSSVTTQGTQTCRIQKKARVLILPCCQPGWDTAEKGWIIHRLYIMKGLIRIHMLFIRDMINDNKAYCLFPDLTKHFKGENLHYAIKP